MFEKCGIRDIFFRAYRSKGFILIVTGVFLALGIVFSVVRAVVSPQLTKESSKGIWVASACYMVTLDSSVEIGNSTVDQVKDKEESMAAAYAAILGADFSREQIYNNLLAKYTKQDIIDYLDLDIAEEELTAFSLSAAFTSTVLDRTSIVNFYIKATDKDFAQAYLEECHAVFNSIPSLVADSQIQYIDGVLDNNLSENNTSSSIERMIIPLMAILGFVLSMLVVFAQALFVPTVNRKSDFCAYGLSVIGEVALSSKKEECKA